MDKRFEVSLVFSVKEVKDGNPADHHDVNLVYHDLPYDGLVAVQQTLLGAVNKLGDLGIGKAQALGLGGQLAAMGFAAPAKRA